MKKYFFCAVYLSIGIFSIAQPVAQRLQRSFHAFESDPQLKYAISSLHVMDAKTGKIVFSKNAMVGLAPASTQKIITSVTAFELLGKDFRYETKFGVDKNEKSKFYIIPSGDPTFGSERWEQTKANEITRQLVSATRGQNISSIAWDNGGWDYSSIPDGWIWQDLGNYYGAGAGKLNWRENQYDIILKSGKKIGDPVAIVRTEPALVGYQLRSDLVSAKKGSGDNAYVYFSANENKGVLRGTIPVEEDKFSISGAFPSSANQFAGELANAFSITASSHPSVIIVQKSYDIIYTHYSPRLDSIIYWFNKKSINLYGEALVKTIGYRESGIGSTDTGIAITRRFWEEKGINADELNISDGSGLSPQNRITTHAQVEILKYARSRDWFPQFFNTLPDYNGMRMKSGTIKDVKGFCGYHKAKDGTEYIFSFLVNNYNGSASALVNNMYKVLDVLK